MVEIKSDILNQIMALPRQGIYALTDDNTKVVQLIKSNDLIHSLVRMSIAIQRGEVKWFTPSSDVQFKLLDENTCSTNLVYYKTLYTEKGYTIEGWTGEGEYVLRVKHDDEMNSIVCARTLGKRDIVLGIFDSRPLADRFKASLERDGYIAMASALNGLTRDFMRKAKKSQIIS